MSGGSKTGEVTACGHRGHCDGARPPTQGLEGVDNRSEPPGLHVLGTCLCQTRQPCGVVSERADVCVAHELLGRGGTDHCAEPAEVGGAPGSLARRTAIVPQAKRLEPHLGSLQSTDGLFPRSAQGPHRFLLHLGHVDRGEVPGAHQAGQCDGVPTVGFDPIPGLLGEIAVEPGATRPRCRDKDEVGACGWEPAEQLSDIALTCPAVPKGGNLGVRCLGDIGDGAGLLMNISPDVECASLGHG